MEAAKDRQSVVRHPAVRIGAGLSPLQPPGWTSFGASFDSMEAMGVLRDWRPADPAPGGVPAGSRGGPPSEDAG